MADVKREVSYDLHFDEDVMRVSRTTTMNVDKASFNEWEEVKRTKNWMIRDNNHIMYKETSIVSI